MLSPGLYTESIPMNLTGANRATPADRVIVYIDGFNLYFGLRSKGWKRYYWLDLCALAAELLSSTQTLVAVRYFTSRVAGPADKQQRQAKFIDALVARGGLSMHYGKYQNSPRKCPACNVRFPMPNEKMTDVNIATTMLVDAFTDQFDTACLVSADSDLVAPVRVVTSTVGKKVVLAFPPDRKSKELEKLATVSFMIGRAAVAKAQLPDHVPTRGGFIIERPPEWR